MANNKSWGESGSSENNDFWSGFGSPGDNGFWDVSSKPGNGLEAPQPSQPQAEAFSQPAGIGHSPYSRGVTGRFDASHSGSFSAQRSGNAGRVALIVGAVVAVLSLVGGITWATIGFFGSDDSDGSNAVVAENADEGSVIAAGAEFSEGSSGNNSAASINPAHISRDERCGSHAEAYLADIHQPRIDYCDGDWMYAGHANLELTLLYYWNQGGWQRYQSDDTTLTNMPCYERGKLVSAGAPEALINKLEICTNWRATEGQDLSGDTGTEYVGGGNKTSSGSSGSATVACDGRWILIVESTIIPLGADPSAENSRVQQKYPGSRVVSGDACSSMRGQVDGGSVYAVYFDAGHDVSEVCRLKSRYGGNARSLNNQADFSDPC